jgi:hypothetical protein
MSLRSVDVGIPLPPHLAASRRRAVPLPRKWGRRKKEKLFKSLAGFSYARPVYGEGGPRPEGVVGGGTVSGIAPSVIQRLRAVCHLPRFAGEERS